MRDVPHLVLDAIDILGVIVGPYDAVVVMVAWFGMRQPPIEMGGTKWKGVLSSMHPDCVWM
jgi:hypothetical protein